MSTPLLRAATLLARPALDAASSPADHGAAAATIRGDIQSARAAAASLAEHGAYERTWQAATVIAECAERMALARLQLADALTDLPATLDALDTGGVP